MTPDKETQEITEAHVDKALDFLLEMANEGLFHHMQRGDPERAVADIRAYIAALVTPPLPEGYRLVPEKPTKEMMKAFGAPLKLWSDGFNERYRAMLEAAPEQREGWRPIAEYRGEHALFWAEELGGYFCPETDEDGNYVIVDIISHFWACPSGPSCPDNGEEG